MVNNRATKNHIVLEVVEQLGIPYREKEKPYSLVIILGEPVLRQEKIYQHFCSIWQHLAAFGS